MFISLSSSVGAVSERKCDYSIQIYLEFDSLVSDKHILSEFQFPIYREDDVLYIREFRLVNIGNCTVISPILNFKIIFPSGDIIKFCSSDIKINGNLSVGEEYIVRRNQSSDNWYSDSFNSKFICGGIKLKEEGKYIIDRDYNISIQNRYYASELRYSSYMSVYNSINTNSFKVYSSEYLRTQKLAKYGFYLAFFTLIIVFLSTIYDIYIKGKERKDNDRRFKTLSKSQNQIIEKNKNIVDQLTKLNKRNPEKIQKDILEKNDKIVEQLTKLNKRNPEKIQNEILQENKTTNIELAKLNKNLSKETKSAKKK